MILDQRLASQLALASIVLSPADLDAERDLLLDSLSRNAGLTGDQRQAMLFDMRRARALGPYRFDSLLRRNASLRALVRTNVTINDAVIRQALDARFGVRYRARFIAVSSQQLASSLRDRILAAAPPSPPAPGLLDRFAAAAFDESTDDSGNRGGILEPISPADPSYPAIVRSTLERMAAALAESAPTPDSAVPAAPSFSSHSDPRRLSPVLALDRGFALLYLEEVIPAQPFEEAAVRPQIEREARLRQERVLMDRKARELLADVGLTVFDRSLQAAWDARGLEQTR